MVHKICHFYLDSLKKIANALNEVLLVACTLTSDGIQYTLYSLYKYQRFLGTKEKVRKVGKQK